MRWTRFDRRSPNGSTRSRDESLASDGALPARHDSGDVRFARGRAEFDSVFADLAKGKRNWQLAAFGALTVSGVLAAGLVALATTSRVTPYVVEVDRLGRAQAFGPAEPIRPVDRRVTIATLAGFVRDLRTVVADPVAQADMVRRSYAFVDAHAAAFLNQYFADPANDPRLLGRDVTRLVEIGSVLPVPGAAVGTQTWKVSWTERTIARNAAGEPADAAWEGYLTTRLIPPSGADRLLANPMGLYVTSITWTQIAARPAGRGSPGPDTSATSSAASSAAASSAGAPAPASSPPAGVVP